jgi:hypothetical protein
MTISMLPTIAALEAVGLHRHPDEGKTCVEYDKPSSLFGQFGNDRISPTAAMQKNSAVVVDMPPEAWSDVCRDMASLFLAKGSPHARDLPA